MGTILETKELSKKFGGLVALDKINLKIEEGSITSLIGPNGAGKSTFLNLISGVYKPDGGETLFKSQLISGLPSYALARLGISRTFQNIRLFDFQTVLENILIALHHRSSLNFLDGLMRTKSYRLKERKLVKQADEILEFMGLSHVKYIKAGSLPYGQRRLLEIARTVASGATLLLLDEPAAGMNPNEIDWLVQKIKEIRDRGTTIFLVEHHMRLVMNISDNIHVLEFGQKISEGTPEEISKDERVIKAYLGRRKISL